MNSFVARFPNTDVAAKLKTWSPLSFSKVALSGVLVLPSSSSFSVSTASRAHRKLRWLLPVN